MDASPARGGNGLVDLADLVRASPTAGRNPSLGACRFYDLNGDGVIDLCDVDAVSCRFAGFGPACCDAARCVACCGEGLCEDRLAAQCLGLPLERRCDEVTCP